MLRIVSPTEASTSTCRLVDLSGEMTVHACGGAFIPTDNQHMVRKEGTETYHPLQESSDNLP